MNAPRDAALDLANRLLAVGHQALFAGGCVRDKILGKEPKDYDIATSATPAEVLRIFPNGNQVGAHFGVIIVRHEKHNIEIATFRTDGSYKDYRRPEKVTFSTAEDDAKRRDFTINGLFENPQSGEIIDYVGGLPDLQAGILRAIGNPANRFREDALRLMRAVRFSSTLGFTLEPETHAAIQANSALLGHIASERVRDEFSRIITAANRRNGLEMLVSTGLAKSFLPEIYATIGCDQPPEWHPEGDVFTHTMIMLEMLGSSAPLELCLAVLLHDIAKPPTRTIDPDGRIRFNGHDAMGAEMTAEILRRMKYANDIISDIVHMVSRHMRFMHVKEMRVAKLKRFMATPQFENEMELHRVDCASSNGFTDNYEFLRAKQAEFAAAPLVPPPLITGRDLIARGLKPGPRFKEILETIQTEQLEGRLAERDGALLFLDTLLA